MGVSDHETWPAQLERLLNAQLGDGVRVVNGGTISYGTFQEMNLFTERGQSTRPHLVIHGLYWNDYMTNHAPRPTDPPSLTADGHFVWEGSQTTETQFQHGNEWLYSHSVLWFTLRNFLRRLQEGQGSGLLGYEVEYQHLINSTVQA